MVSEAEVWLVAEQLEMWTVYDHPSDHPDHFVARRWVGDRPEREVFLSDSIEPLRAWFEAHGLVRLTRSIGDDPAIVETWL